MLAINKKTLCVEHPDWPAVFAGLHELREPIIFKGLVSHWPMVSKGLQSDLHLMDYILSFYSGRSIVCYQAAPEKHGRFFYTEDATQLDFTSHKTSLPEVFEHIKTASQQAEPPVFYVGSTTVDVCLPGMRDDNDLEFFDRDPLVSIWMGNQSKVSAHFDSPDNIACCVAGRRTFTLFPPDQLENLYIGPLHFTPSGQVISMVDFDNPDFEKFPRFVDAVANAEQAELAPGDALFIPSMWWHHVESMADFNVLVNYWWRDDQPFMDRPMDALFHAILSIRDLPMKEKNAWRNLFDYYIFSEQNDKYEHIPDKARAMLDPLDEMNARRLRSLLINKLNK